MTAQPSSKETTRAYGATQPGNSGIGAFADIDTFAEVIEHIARAFDHKTWNGTPIECVRVTLPAACLRKDNDWSLMSNGVFDLLVHAVSRSIDAKMLVYGADREMRAFVLDRLLTVLSENALGTVGDPIAKSRVSPPPPNTIFGALVYHGRTASGAIWEGEPDDLRFASLVRDVQRDEPRMTRLDALFTAAWHANEPTSHVFQEALAKAR